MTSPTTDARERELNDIVTAVFEWAARREDAEECTCAEYDESGGRCWYHLNATERKAARMESLRDWLRDDVAAVRTALLAEVRARVEAERKAPCDEWCAEMERCDCGFAKNNAALDAILAALAAMEGA